MSMLFTMDQLKHLEANKDDTYRFIGQEAATEREREMLREFDETYISMNGKHLITNYEELK